ncbi:MAG: ABC transporter permease [Candidatus Omnitrophica bacterium]|nr:ABC transporter permease [Candidatus Omnitrophota bacterium]
MIARLSHFLVTVGRNTQLLLIEVGRLSNLARHFLYWTFAAPLAGKQGLRRHSFVQQLIFMGNESVFIVFLVTASVGAVLALQAAYQLRQFGAVLYTGALVSVSMTRELGPIVTSIVIAGRVGASITAEIGTMKVQEEVDALTTMGIPPVPFLVVPRILAIAIMLPCLTALGDLIGIFGGYLIGISGLGLDSNLYLRQTFEALIPKDILTGIAKSFVFAILIGLISTYKGLSVEGGAEGVGRATTESVVLSIIAIIVSDCICTGVFYYIFP